jgi:hypothetical protein
VPVPVFNPIAGEDGVLHIVASTNIVPPRLIEDGFAATTVVLFVFPVLPVTDAPTTTVKVSPGVTGIQFV